MSDGGLAVVAAVSKAMKIGIVACGAIVREIIAVANRQAWDYELTAVPAQLHNWPDQIPAAVATKLDAWAGDFDLIVLGYADCGTGGQLDEVLRRYDHVVRIPGPHCYDFYAGQTFTQHSEAYPGTFYLTDFLARHFDGLVWKGLGLDRLPELKDAYFGNYSHLLYIQQLADNDQDERARAAAERLGVEYVRVETGLDELEQRLVSLVEQRRGSMASADLLERFDAP